MYETIELFKEDLTRLSCFLKKKEYEALFPYFQGKEEKLVLGLTGHGPYDEIHSCWFILSNLHVFIIPKAHIGQSVDVISIPLIEIDSATESRGVLLSRVTLSVKGELYNLHDTSKSGSASFIGYFNNRKQELTEPQVDASEDYIARIERLFELKEKGVLTDEEYTEEKNRILTVMRKHDH